MEFPEPETVDGPYPHYKHNLYRYEDQANAMLDKMVPGQWKVIRAGENFTGKAPSFEAVLRRVARGRGMKLFASYDQVDRNAFRIMYKKVIQL